jgi:hypothetical protein
MPWFLLVELYELQLRLLFALNGTAMLSQRVLAVVAVPVRAIGLSRFHP